MISLATLSPRLRSSFSGSVAFDREVVFDAFPGVRRVFDAVFFVLVTIT